MLCVLLRVYSQDFRTVAQHATLWPFSNDCVEFTNESICLLRQAKNSTCFGLADHLQVYAYRIANILRLC
jgi:hypothetical protein